MRESPLTAITYIVTWSGPILLVWLCGYAWGRRTSSRHSLVRLRVVEFANRCIKEPEMAQDNETARTVQSVGRTLLEVVQAAESESK